VNTQAPKRAALYLRVSSPGQVRTDYDPEGLSLPSQRERCIHKAHSLHAEVAREYIEPGVSAKSLIHRKRFRQMIADIREQRDIDYVIVWSVSRWARNQEDHWTARGLINRAGAKLISVKEPIGEDTSTGVMVEGVMAAVAESRLIEISDDVTRAMQRKVEVGGKPGMAPLGYLNVREPLPQGGEIRTIVIDPERADIIRWGFETYATGLYSLIDMVTLLAARGLRSRGNRRYSPRPLQLSAVHALFGNPFYMGQVRYKGKLYKGRHEPLISEELFERVQAVLKAHNTSGERDRKHQHYLKGSIHCGRCNHRLVYSRNTGRGGTFEYFICGPSQRRECDAGYMRADEIEAAIEQHYNTIRLTPKERASITAEVERRLAGLAATSKQEISRCRALLTDLKEQERKLMGKHYKDEISDEFFSEEAACIKQQRTNAQAIMDRLNIRHDELSQFMALVLNVTGRDLHNLYLRAKPHIRRLMNQAIFETIWIEPDEDQEIHIRTKLASPIAEVIQLNAAIQRIKAKQRTSRAAQAILEPMGRPLVGIHTPENAEASDPWQQESEDFDEGWSNEVMVGRAGIEPATLGLRGPSIGPE
jgi:site-specific DNA recombinase